MPGLINVAKGTGDFYLTGNPQITHFKVVYRRHTRFAVESFQLDFDDEVGFGLTSSIVLPRIGDLIHKSYLQITLPEVYFTRKPNESDIAIAKTNYNNAINTNTIISQFIKFNTEVYRSAYEVYSADNTIYCNTIIATIITQFTLISENDKLNFNNKTRELGFDPSLISLDLVTRLINIPDITPKIKIFERMQYALAQMHKLKSHSDDLVLQASEKLEDAQSEYYKFAWVDKIGHALIDYIQIDIGGERIDRHYGDWYNIWSELSCSHELYPVYNKMIGNVPELTVFDRTIKPKYNLFIPLQFWFCKTNGSALPLAALEYHDVSITVKLRNIQECCYFEFMNQETIDISDWFEDSNFTPQVNLLIDYVYLDKVEQIKFAQAAHEYLIDQLQLCEMNNITNTEFKIELDFNNPCIELIWIIQKDSHARNEDGYTKCQLHNYSLIGQTGNPIKSVQIDYNGHTKIKQTGEYFNYIQPHAHHTSTPSDGICVYSFSLFPEEFQPSGNCNIGRFKQVTLTVQLNPAVFMDTESVHCRIYARSHNVLRIIGGMAACAYSR